jgi:carbonic anhydrase
MVRVIEVTNQEGIPSTISGSPIGLLLEYHNLGRPFDPYDEAQLLIGMCMDNRKSLRIPDDFAYIIRAGGANLRPSEFKVSYAISIGGVLSIALITHTQCGMVNLDDRKEPFVQGLVDRAGWERTAAEEHFANFAPASEIGDEVSFACSEADRLGQLYPGVQVVPLLYKVEDDRLYLLEKC